MLFPDHRYLEIDYYTYLSNQIQGRNIYLEDQFDPRVDRVKFLYAPAGCDSAPVQVYQFIYDLNIKYDKKKPQSREILNGATYVYDASVIKQYMNTTAINV